MLKNSSLFFLAFLSSSTLAAVSVDLYNAPPSSIKQFFKSSGATGTRTLSSSQTNALEAISTTKIANKTVVRLSTII
jgi:hypothetical protein